MKKEARMLIRIFQPVEAPAEEAGSWRKEGGEEDKLEM